MEESHFLRTWLAALLAGLGAKVDEKTRAQVLESCGWACAFHLGSIETVKAIHSKVKQIDELLHLLNQQEGFWCGKWIREGEIIYSICEKCGCPLIRSGWAELSPTFCLCSMGWVKTVFEFVLGTPVQVELEQAIGQGDPVCKQIHRFGKSIVVKSNPPGLTKCRSQS